MVTSAVLARRKGSDGIDAPYLLFIPFVLFAAHIVQGVVSGLVWPFVAAGLVMACIGCGLHTSLRGKFPVWSEILAGLALRGDEQILDLGCGRGAVLLGAAQRLTTGRSVGVDLWRKVDQSGNAAKTTWRNAIAEAVAERVELCTAAMIALPFEDESFDVVLSSVAIHNVEGRAGRDRVIEEAVRVLRPGSRLLIADILAAGQYRVRLAQLGLTNVGHRDLGWRMWWSGPWLPTRLMTATKPPTR
jgi:arsenite methyltransferase